uniref:MULE transposase domain-containing protein n=1 Tax=Lactuca sativa TaxID=4236 RepID=A0A9R1W9U6_LACSA|nr:hypothetical protein LSAT_V11C200062670 [Lactuca sativa]
MLKSKVELLTAIGRDADNHVYPIAWAVVIIENKDNWSCFIELLVDDLDLGGGNGLVVVSDQHKGLLRAVTLFLPHVEYKQCVVENGISDCFNSMIRQTGKKHLLIMLEEIRIYLMERVYHQRDFPNQWRGDYGPNTLEKLTKFRKDEMLSGIPCVHGQATINYLHRDPLKFLSPWFHKDKLIATYMDNILLQRTDFVKTLPPLVRRMPGRPKVNRRKHASESQDSKYPTQREKIPRTVGCGKCQHIGHNKSSWKNKEVPKFGRPRKDGIGQPYFDHFPPKRNGTRIDGEGQALLLTMFNKKKFNLYKIWGMMYQLKLVKMYQMKGIRWVVKLLSMRMWLSNLLLRKG